MVAVTRALSDGANVNGKSKDGVTALYVAAQFGHRDIAELLITKGADGNVTDSI
jgi:ankyrin repeat protein